MSGNAPSSASIPCLSVKMALAAPMNGATDSSERESALMYRLTITLATGEQYGETVDRMPRFWKSWLMQRMTYGTVFYGATFSREAIA